MAYNEKLILTTESSIIFPHYSETGELHSKYMDGDDYQIVPMKPTDLIDLNLRMSGTSLKGAVEGARNLLGSGTNAPVVISKKHSMYWFPLTSPKSPKCIWVSVGHIRNCIPNGRNGVTVYLKNGSIVNLPCSLHIFRSRRHRALELRSLIESHSDQIQKTSGSYMKTYFICQEAGLNYNWKEGQLLITK